MAAAKTRAASASASAWTRRPAPGENVSCSRGLASATGSGKCSGTIGHQAPEAHGLHCACRRADIARMAGETTRSGFDRAFEPCYIKMPSSYVFFRQSTWTASAETTINASDAQYRHQGRSPSSQHHQPGVARTRSHQETTNDFVIEVDRAAEGRSARREAHPAHGILAEESGATGPESEYPVDHRPARRHHQLHSYFPSTRFDRACEERRVDRRLSAMWCETNWYSPARPRRLFNDAASRVTRRTRFERGAGRYRLPVSPDGQSKPASVCFASRPRRPLHPPPRPAALDLTFAAGRYDAFWELAFARDIAAGTLLVTGGRPDSGSGG